MHFLRHGPSAFLSLRTANFFPTSENSFETRRLLLLSTLWSLTGHSPAFFAKVWLGLLPSVTFPGPSWSCFCLLKQQLFDLLCDRFLAMLLNDSWPGFDLSFLIGRLFVFRLFVHAWVYLDVTHYWRESSLELVLGEC